MPFTLDDHQLRELAPLLEELTKRVSIDRMDTPAAPGWPDLLYAARAAAGAHPECPCCHGYGKVDLPRFGAALEYVEVEEHDCPVCRPWPQGFPGQTDGNPVRRLREGGKVWLIPPYVRGEHAERYRGQLLPWTWDGNVAVQAPSEF